jgi:F420-non-reducing hydrogenase iron-sulfur subunit
LLQSLVLYEIIYRCINGQGGGTSLACISLEPAYSGPLRQKPMSMEVVIFACQQAVPEPEVLKAQWGKGPASLRVLSEPCSSKVESFQMLRTLATPVDLVWLIGCEETACRYQDGSRRLGGRVRYVQRYLEEIGLEADRLGRSLVTPGDAQALTAIIKEVQARLKALGEIRIKSRG